MGASCGQRPTMAIVRRVRWRQAKRLFGKLCGDGRSAAIGREHRGFVKQSGDVRIRLVPREREMAGSRERIFARFRDASMDSAPHRPQVVVEDRRQQWVGKPNRPVLALDHMRLDCGSERICCDARPLQGRH
jgi:hypothetical protein